MDLRGITRLRWRLRWRSRGRLLSYFAHNAAAAIVSQLRGRAPRCARLADAGFPACGHGREIDHGFSLVGFHCILCLLVQARSGLA
jgi:hypothetical protein